MKKKRNRICRRIAVTLTVALLVGQSHAFVLAEESASDTQTQTEAPFGEIGADAPNSGNVTGGGNTGNTDNGLEQGDHNGEAGGPKPEESKNPEDNKDDGDRQDGEDWQDKCVCGTKCAEDAVNTDCPVCAADYVACAGKEDDTENDGSNDGKWYG